MSNEEHFFWTRFSRRGQWAWWISVALADGALLMLFAKACP